MDERELQAREKEPYHIQWLDSAYQQTLFPNAPWHQIEDKISQLLAQKVEKQFLKVERKEALLQLLGQDFVDKYMSSAKRNPTCLEPPAMGAEEKMKILREAQAYLNSQIYKAAKEAGYNHLTSPNVSGNPPGDYSGFLQHTFKIYKTGLDRELYRQEQQLTKQKKHELNLEKKFLKQRRIPAPSRLKMTGSGYSTATSGMSMKPSSGVLRAMVHKVDGDPPPLWGAQSDEIGKSILQILQTDPRKFDHVAGRLHGRQLPGSLRAYMWSDILFKNERKRLKEVVVEKVVRERFAKAIARGIQELRIKRATSSPISGLIENAVIETYNKTTGLVSFKSGEHMKEAVRTLNVLYVYDRSYEPYLIYWLFPLQIAFQTPQMDTRDDKGENVLELGMYLDLLNSNCFPSWPSVFAIAEKVLTTVRQADPDFYNHLKMISRKNVKVNPKEFLVQLLHEEKAKAEALFQTTPGGLREQEMSAQLLADPLVFIRRWIGEGFVSILDAPSVMYVWDQCFLQSWQTTVIENFCIALLELLRYKFMAARDYAGMKEVFMNECCKLYTVDIQHAWIHLERGNDPSDIPFMNRQRPDTPLSRLSPISQMSSAESVGILNPCGIKDVKLRLIIPSEVMQKEAWLATVDPNCLKLSVVAYFGEVRLQSHTSILPSSTQSVSQDNYGNTIYEVVYPEDKFVFRDLDIAPYDLEREMGAYTYAIVRVDYRTSGPGDRDKPPIPVGWARIPLYQRHPVHGATSVTSLEIKWDLQDGDHTFDLHPGEIPDSLISTQPVTPSEHEGTEEGNILGYNSKLMAVVYDPKNEPKSKFDPALPVQIAPRDTRDPSPVPKPSPKPKPRQVTPKIPTPAPAVVPSPAPRLTQEEPWVAHKKEAARSNPAPTGAKDPIDLYIDGVRFIPDNASIVKVTGRILRTGSVGNVEDILALPDLNSSARSPAFNYKLTINTDKKEADVGMLAFLRVYSVDVVGDTLGVIGSCLIPFFDNKKKLRVGGYQMRLHNGMPVLSQPAGIAGIKHTDLDTIPVVPSMSLLVRILPHSQSQAAYPGYSSGYFESAACQPNRSEYRIFQSYKEHMAYPRSVREMIMRIMENEGLPPHGKTDGELLDWLETRLDIRRHLTPGRPAENLSLLRCVRYKLKMGMNVRINQVYGMQEGLYLQCFARVSPGSKVLSMEPTQEGYGGEEKFVTLKHDFDSYQQAQEWTDEATTLHPFYDQYSCLVIQLFGMDVKYQPRPDHAAAGTITDTRGQQLSLEDESKIIGWAVLPLFEGNSVLMGNHHIPVLKGKPPADLLQQLTTTSAEQVLKSQNWSSRNKFAAGSLSVTLWDAHFDYDHLEEMVLYEYMLETVGKLTDYRKARQPSSGRKMTNFVLDVLEAKFKKQGTGGAIFQKELGFFTQLMESTFYDLMENALMTAGYGPL